MYSMNAIEKFVQQLVKNSNVQAIILDIHCQVICNTLDNASVGSVIGGIEPSKRFNVKDGRTYMRFNYGDDSLIVGVDGEDKTAESNCCFYAMLLEMHAKSSTGAGRVTRQEYCKRMVKGQLTPSEMMQMAPQFDISGTAKQRAMIIRVDDSLAVEIYNVIESAFADTESRNVLFSYNAETICFIVEINEEMDDEYFMQLGSAIYQSVQAELSTSISIGVGNQVANIGFIHESFRQAEKAITIGELIHSDKLCLLYNELGLELFLSQIPKEVANEFSEPMDNPEYTKLLKEEMLLTINKFFENNLNLSETARQLYIHRNTLVYRLDKIQRVMDLDLRNFYDAVTFKLMMILKQMN